MKNFRWDLISISRLSPSNETELRERRSAMDDNEERGGGGDQRAAATVYGRCRAAIKPILLFNER